MTTFKQSWARGCGSVDGVLASTREVLIPSLPLIWPAAGVHACNPGSGRQRLKDQFKGIFGKTTNGGKPGMQETLLASKMKINSQKENEAELQIQLYGARGGCRACLMSLSRLIQGRVQRKRSRNLSGEKIGPQVFKCSLGWYVLSWATHFTGGHLRFEYSFSPIPLHQPIKVFFFFSFFFREKWIRPALLGWKHCAWLLGGNAVCRALNSLSNLLTSF